MWRENKAKIISCVIAIFPIVGSLFLCGYITGVDQGYSAALYHGRNTITFGDDGFRIYTVLAFDYSLIALCFCLYIIGSLVKEKTGSHYLCILSLTVFSGLYCHMYNVKDKILSNAVVRALPEYSWLPKSVQFDRACLVVAVILLVMQITMICINYRESKNKTA